MSANAPTSQTTLAILLGASEWPNADNFEDSAAFANSAQRFRNYLLDTDLFGLPTENFLDLFNSNASPDEIDTEIHSFLEQRCSLIAPNTQKPSDVILLFIGHGGFDRFSDFFLAIRRTRSASIKPSSIDIRALAETIRYRARFLRRYIILDCCFAASANPVFQSSALQAAATQAYKAFAESGEKKGFPSRGTSLLCSSRHDKPSLLTPDGKYTMFSEALLNALEQGNPKLRKSLDLRAIGKLAEDYLSANYGTGASKPEVHSPDQTEGDVASVPIFPNAAKRVLIKTDESVRDVIDKMLKERDYEEAESLLLEKIESAPRKSYYWSLLGVVYMQSDKYDEAARAFSKVLEIGPQTAERHYNLGLAYYAQEDFKKAKSCFQSASRLEPNRLLYEHFIAKAEAKILPPTHIIVLRLLAIMLDGVVRFVGIHPRIALSFFLLMVGLLILSVLRFYFRII